MASSSSLLWVLALIFGLSITVLLWWVTSPTFLDRAGPALKAIRRQLSPKEAERLGFLLSTTLVIVMSTEPVGIGFVASFTALFCALGLYAQSYMAWVERNRKQKKAHRVNDF